MEAKSGLVAGDVVAAQIGIEADDDCAVPGFKDVDDAVDPPVRWLPGGVTP